MNIVTLKSTLGGHLRSLEMILFESLNAVSYFHPIATAVSYSCFDIIHQRDRHRTTAYCIGRVISVSK